MASCIAFLSADAGVVCRAKSSTKARRKTRPAPVPMALDLLLTPRRRRYLPAVAQLKHLSWRDQFIYASRSNASKFYMLSARSTTSRYKNLASKHACCSLMNSTCQQRARNNHTIDRLNLRCVQNLPGSWHAKALNSFEELAWIGCEHVRCTDRISRSV